MRIFSSKRGEDHTGLIVAIVIAVAIIFLVLYFLSDMFRKSDSITESMLLCNTDLQKCGCFFKDSTTTNPCPDGTVSKIENSPYCPPDEKSCTDTTAYKTEMKAAAKTKGYGTCCVGSYGSISKSKLKSS